MTKSGMMIAAMFVAAAALADDAGLVPPVNDEFADRPNPIASELAMPGGTIVYAAPAAPKSLNPYLDNNTFSYQVFDMLYESLLSSDPLTGDNAPGLARKWDVSEDKREFTFYLNPLARWSDGTAVTAEDVVWTFDTIMAPTNQTGSIKVALQTFMATPPEIIDPLTVKFTADETHWRNLNAVGGFEIMPKHAFEGRDFNKVNTDFPVVSGPYRISGFKPGVSLELERRSDWWGRALASSRGTFNFGKVVFRFFNEQDNAFDAFLASEVDVFPVYRAALWVNRTSGRKFENNWIV
ncbi:MAG: ABC transporter substrate-binding protein, partial [Kiritimatiellae bacterium]|nr:ABC transporter substrate-binding protein [Kiritimatiellia bacterium]